MRAKEITIDDHEITYIEGTPTNYLIFHGESSKGEKVKFWVNPDRLVRLFQIYEKMPGHIGHAKWHEGRNDVSLPCESCPKY